MIKKVTRREFLRDTTRASITLGLIGAGSCFIVGCARRHFDLVIKGGTVYDGLGGEPLMADLGVRGDRIVALGDLANKTARRVINATGLAVSPGFIDVHSHTDLVLLVDPKAQSKIRQGVTTEVSGNCGYSPFPISGPGAEKRKESLEKEFEVQIDWTDVDGFLSRLERNGTAVNYVTLVGHSTIRRAVMGLENRTPSVEELQEMQRLVREAVEQGAVGLSTGLEYTPGSFATTEEVIDLCKAAREYEGIYATHMRSEDVKLEEALEEAIRIAKEADVELQISHLKACQQRNWYKVPRVLERIAEVSNEGVGVHADRYTYTAYGTTLKLMFPLWAREGDDEAFVGRLKDESQWKKIRPYLVDKVNALGSWERVLITRVESEERKSCQGKTIAQLAAEAKTDPFVFARELLIEEGGKVNMCGFAMSEENTEKVLAFPLTMIGSDGEAISPEGILGNSNPHPRFYGTFPRYLGYYIRERKILPLKEAIRRITSMPAKKFRLVDRGVLAEGKLADIVLFDPQTVIDKATFTDPHHYPEGIDYVIVNGKVVIDNGEHTGQLSGKVLRRA